MLAHAPASQATADGAISAESTKGSASLHACATSTCVHFACKESVTWPHLEQGLHCCAAALPFTLLNSSSGLCIFAWCVNHGACAVSAIMTCACLRQCCTGLKVPGSRGSTECCSDTNRCRAAAHACLAACCQQRLFGMFAACACRIQRSFVA